MEREKGRKEEKRKEGQIKRRRKERKLKKEERKKEIKGFLESNEDECTMYTYFIGHHKSGAKRKVHITKCLHKKN